MKRALRHWSWLAWLAVLPGCTSVEIPPEKSAWAETVRQRILQANATNYVFITVADKEQRDILEYLAFKQGKATQRIKKDGQLTECVFEFRH